MNSLEESTKRAPAVLKAAASRTFEELYFLVIDPNVDAPPPSPELLAFAVRFVGPIQGVLTVRMPPPLTQVIAANMLGADEAVEEWLAMDTAGELANVICGHVLPELYGAKQVFRIEAPAPVPADVAMGRLVATAAMAVEGSRVDVGLWLSREGGVA